MSSDENFIGLAARVTCGLSMSQVENARADTVRDRARVAGTPVLHGLVFPFLIRSTAAQSAVRRTSAAREVPRRFGAHGIESGHAYHKRQSYQRAHRN
jgi:hypothetical protein